MPQPIGWRPQTSRESLRGAVYRSGVHRLVPAVFAALLGCAGVPPEPPADSGGGQGPELQPFRGAWEPRTRAVWVGDILLADAAQGALDANGYDFPFARVGDLLDGDVVIGNAEGPITELTEPYNDGQPWSYNALPPAAEALAAAGFDAVSLANNHLADRGPAGLDDTLAHLTAAGVQPFGGGRTREEALQPFVFDAQGGPVAVFGFGTASAWVPPAGPGPGMLLLNASNASAARSEAEAIGAALTVGFVHWGQNYSGVTSRQRDEAALLAAAGFDLLIGHGPHNQQGVERVDGALVLWSLGNFTFGTPGRFDADVPGFGLVASTVFDRDGLSHIELRCIVTDNDRVAFQPAPCSEPEAAEILGGLGELVDVHDGIGWVDVPR
jgi:hypothetical protein